MVLVVFKTFTVNIYWLWNLFYTMFLSLDCLWLRSLEGNQVEGARAAKMPGSLLYRGNS